MAISRYGDAEESLGRVQILLDLDIDLAGRDVILVEDIVDTGLTLRYLLGALRARGPASLEVCTLLDKAVRRIVPLTPRYVGLRLPGPVRRRVRARLPGALPQPARHPAGRRPRGAARPIRAPSCRCSPRAEARRPRRIASVARRGCRGYARIRDDRDGAHRRPRRTPDEPADRAAARARRGAVPADLDRRRRGCRDRAVAAGGRDAAADDARPDAARCSRSSPSTCGGSR